MPARSSPCKCWSYWVRRDCSSTLIASRRATRGWGIVREAVAPSAIRNSIRDLKAFAAWLGEERYTPDHVLAAIKVPKADETPH